LRPPELSNPVHVSMSDSSHVQRGSSMSRRWRKRGQTFSANVPKKLDRFTSLNKKCYFEQNVLAFLTQSSQNSYWWNWSQEEEEEKKRMKSVASGRSLSLSPTSLTKILNERLLQNEVSTNRWVLVSISSTFNALIFCTKVLSYFCQSQNVTRKKLPKRLLYEKRAHKMLMKLTLVSISTMFYEQLLPLQIPKV